MIFPGNIVNIWYAVCVCVCVCISDWLTPNTMDCPFPNFARFLTVKNKLHVNFTTSCCRCNVNVTVVRACARVRRQAEYLHSVTLLKFLTTIMVKLASMHDLHLVAKSLPYECETEHSLYGIVRFETRCKRVARKVANCEAEGVPSKREAHSSSAAA